MAASTTSALVAAALLALILTGCSSAQDAPAAGTASDPVSVVPTFASTGATDVPDSGAASVSVAARLDVPASPATRALVSYTRAHAQAVIAGSVTSELRTLTSPSLLAYQRRTVASARSKGFVVPTRPRMKIVSADRRGPGQEALGVCYWLPSVEYVDAVSGAPASEVPKAWIGAIARVARTPAVGQPVTWIVAKVGPPTKRDEVDCGG
jgi:hypothetical protein